MSAKTNPSTKSATTPRASAKSASAKQEAEDEIKVEIRTEVATAAVDPLSRIGRAEAIIRRNVIWSLGAGVLPVPLLDMVLASGVQVKMLKELSELYEVEFSESIGKKLLASLLSSVGGVTFGAIFGASITKLVPVLGSALGAATLPLFVGAFTHATGKVFLMHFESGGTVLDFDPHAMRRHFKEELQQAKEKVAQVHEDEQAKAASGPA